MPGVREPSAPRDHLRLTAAVPSERVVCIATLSFAGGRLYLVPTCTALFEIENYDQASVLRLAEQLFAYCSAHRIRELLVRRPPSSGPHAVSGRTETVLQLLPVTCAHVSSSRVAAWVKSGNYMLPLPQAALLQRQRDFQQRAIETAGFGIDHLLTNTSHPATRV